MVFGEAGKHSGFWCLEKQENILAQNLTQFRDMQEKDSTPVLWNFAEMQEESREKQNQVKKIDFSLQIYSFIPKGIPAALHFETPITSLNDPRSSISRTIHKQGLSNSQQSSIFLKKKKKNKKKK